MNINSFILIGLLSFALTSKSGTFPVVLSVSLIVTAGASNLIDRMRHDGFVVDFLNVGIGSFRTGIFNFADVAIMGGIIILFFMAFRKRKENR